MSLSLARPILIAPGIDTAEVRPGRRIFIIEVATFADSPTREVSGAAAWAGGTCMGSGRKIFGAGCCPLGDPTGCTAVG